MLPRYWHAKQAAKKSPHRPRHMPALMNSELYRNVREGMITKRLWKECQSCGRLHTLRRDHVERQFEALEGALEMEAVSGRLEPGEAEALQRHLAQFRELAAERFGEAPKV